jgi:hypothetical protein
MQGDLRIHEVVQTTCGADSATPLQRLTQNTYHANPSYACAFPQSHYRSQRTTPVPVGTAGTAKQRRPTSRGLEPRYSLHDSHL